MDRQVDRWIDVFKCTCNCDTSWACTVQCAQNIFVYCRALELSSWVTIALERKQCSWVTRAQVELQQYKTTAHYRTRVVNINNGITSIHRWSSTRCHTTSTQPRKRNNQHSRRRQFQKHAYKRFHDNISNSAMRVQYIIHLSLTPGITTWFYTSYIFQKFDIPSIH